MHYKKYTDKIRKKKKENKIAKNRKYIIKYLYKTQEKKNQKM